MRHTLSTLILVVSLSSLCAACSDSSATPTDAARDRDVSDARVVDAPATDTPGADAPAVDAPAVDGPAADGPAADGPAADGPAADAPPADAPAPDTTADSSTDASVDTLAPPSWLDDTSMPLPTSIKQLGIFPDPTDRTRVHSRLVAYTPAYALWTDAADKRRWIYLPPNSKVDNTTSAWTFPPGTVFFKHFEYPGQPVETRVMRRTNNKFEFATYQWNAAGTDATLLGGNTPTVVAIATQPTVLYAIPTETQCKGCHDSNVQRVGTNDVFVQVIGFDELRLNSTLSGATQTQLAALAARGIFSAALPASPAAIPGSATARAAKGWLHGNCAHCHNRGFKFDAHYALIEASTVNLPANKPLIVPGKPADSRLYQAAFVWGTAGLRDMPPVGVSIYDQTAKPDVSAWISGL